MAMLEDFKRREHEISIEEQCLKTSSKFLDIASRNETERIRFPHGHMKDPNLTAREPWSFRPGLGSLHSRKVSDSG